MDTATKEALTKGSLTIEIWADGKDVHTITHSTKWGRVSEYRDSASSPEEAQRVIDERVSGLLSARWTKE